MNNPKLHFTAITVILFMAFHMPGQSLHAYALQSNDALRLDNYPSAPKQLMLSYKTQGLQIDDLLTKKLSTHQLSIFKITEGILNRMPDSLKTNLNESAILHAANVKKDQGKYGQAAHLYKKYLDAHADTSDLIYQKAKIDLKNCLQAKESIGNASRIKVVHLGENINTAHPDFAPLRYADKLYFSTSWQETPKSKPVTRIYAAIQDDPAKLIPENTDRKDAHSSHMSLTADGRRMYFTICQDHSPGEHICQIFYRERKYEGDWTAPRRLPRNVIMEGFTSTQPAAGYDKSLKKEVLFFASDRPGGQGGMDIWCSVIERDGTFGNPFPLPFNTPQDDITPFFHQASQNLFFSSKGLPGFGGFDIFQIKKTGPENWSEPENIGYPFNSGYDDIYYTFHSGSKRAYFSSSRPGCQCEVPPAECKCIDIYEAEIFSNVNVLTFNALDSTQLAGVQIDLVDKADGRTDTLFVNANSHDALIPLELERNYRITASLDGFSQAETEVSTSGVTNFANFKRQLYLQPQVELLVRTFNAIDSTALKGSTLYLGFQDGGRGVVFQNDENSHEHIFPLKFDKEYTLKGSRKFFSADSTVISTAGMKQPERLYLDLYLSPFSDLPLTLYFDNDQPRYVNPADTLTSLTYEETYQQFLNRKNDFVTGYSSGLNSREVEAAQIEIRSFFEDEVEANFNRLQSICQALENYLAEGKSIKIEVTGYASPLASSEYNNRLTRRRISSLTNHFKEFNNGALKRYFDNGQLALQHVAKGEAQSEESVSDDKQNVRQSIFSPEASKLRRVTITGIRIQQK